MKCIVFYLCFGFKYLLLSMLFIGLGPDLFAKERLVFAIDVVRHGDRSPLILSSETKKIWKNGPGQLTPVGMRQAYEFGKRLRQRYVYETHLLPEKYDIGTMRVRSSSCARTMMTAQSILLGLYPLGTGPLLLDSIDTPPQRFQPIPIWTVPYAQDALLVPNHDKAKYHQLLVDYVFNQPEWVHQNDLLRSNYARWSQLVTYNINTLFDLIRVSDRLWIEKLHHISLPSGLTLQEANQMIQAGEWAFLKIMNQPELAMISGKALTETIQRELQLAATQSRKLRYILFVAHDTTLAAQLKMLGQSIKIKPHYVSEIHYGLFDKGNQQYEVRITYNQKPILIRSCGRQCPLEQFLKLPRNTLTVRHS